MTSTKQLLLVLVMTVPLMEKNTVVGQANGTLGGYAVDLVIVYECTILVSVSKMMLSQCNFLDISCPRNSATLYSCHENETK